MMEINYEECIDINIVNQEEDIKKIASSIKNIALHWSEYDEYVYQNYAVILETKVEGKYTYLSGIQRYHDTLQKFTYKISNDILISNYNNLIDPNSENNTLFHNIMCKYNNHTGDGISIEELYNIIPSLNCKDSDDLELNVLINFLNKIK